MPRVKPDRRLPCHRTRGKATRTTQSSSR
jgi:hypothetical protein